MSAPADELTNRDRTFAVSVVLRRRKASGISGAFDRYSIARKPTRAKTERASGTAVWIVKSPSVAATVNAYTSRTRPAVTLTAPGMSIRRTTASPPFRAMYRCAKTVAAAPIGAFTNMTDLQPKAAVRTPPAIEPAANPADSTETRIPNARFRSGPSGNVAAKIAKAVAVVMAAAMPWMARETTRERSDGASPAVSDASVNNTIPTRNIRFWP